MIGLLANHGHWKTTTFVGALRHDRMAAPLVLDGPMNGAAFHAYVEQVLAPTLHPDDIVVQGNLPAHKPAKVAITAVMRQLIILANALLRDDRPWTPKPA
jgi:hypothetical protein